MRAVLLAGLLALGAGGCMSSVEAERRASIHEQRADWFAARRDYRRAGDEQREAERLHGLARERHFQETATAPVLVPSRM